MKLMFSSREPFFFRYIFWGYINSPPRMTTLLVQSFSQELYARKILF